MVENREVLTLDRREITRVISGRNNREVQSVRKIAGRLVPFDGFVCELKLRSLLTYLFISCKYNLDHIGIHFDSLKYCHLRLM